MGFAADSQAQAGVAVPGAGRQCASCVWLRTGWHPSLVCGDCRVALAPTSPPPTTAPAVAALISLQLVDFMKVVLFANTDWYLFNFRGSFARALQDAGYDVLLI